MISLLKFVALTKQLSDQHSTTQPGTASRREEKTRAGFYIDAAIEITLEFYETHHHGRVLSVCAPPPDQKLTNKGYKLNGRLK